MFVIRPVTKKDKDVFAEFSCSGTLGIRNLHHDKDKIDNVISLSETSFARDVKKPQNEEYVFVIEDLSTGRIGGTCAILSSMDPKNTCNFRLETIPNHSLHPAVNKETKVLKLVTKLKQASEVCSLYLQPTFRHSGQGRLLSLSRFLFIASHRYRFRNKIVAELRGYIDQRQISPFWEAVGQHFCNLSFVELMEQIELNKINIHEIMPRYPIYHDLLPKEAQEVLGKTHEMSRPAQNMLINEGFELMDEFDALEAGPSMMASASRIRSIRESRNLKVEVTPDPYAEGTEYIICNGRIDFRACYGSIKIKGKQGIITQEVASALQVKNGDTIRYVTIH